MHYIGLTGRSGSGKTVVASVAEELKIPVLDCDALYRRLTERPPPLLEEIAARFGPEAAEGGKLNRAYLREIVFRDEEKREELDTLTGRFMRGFLEDLAASAHGIDLVLLDAPTLFQTGLPDLCSRVVCVISEDEACVRRIVRRDGICVEDAVLRLKNQPSNGFFRANGTDILMNNGTEHDFRHEARKLLRILRRMP